MSLPNPIQRLSSAPDVLSIEWADGQVSEYASLWLRDNLPEDRDPHSGQRLVDIADLPLRPKIRRASSKHDTLQVEWENEARVGTFRLDWLAAQATRRQPTRPERIRRRWLEGACLDPHHDFAWAALSEIRTAAWVRAAWLTRLLQDGIAFLSDVPCEEDALLEAMTMVGRVAETNYGEVFDVRSVPRPENLAYSDLGLGLHTDNPYREPVPGFQALHALVTSDEGGESLFADGFAIAEHLRRSDPEGFAQLTATAVPFHYRSAGADLYAERPLIQLACDGEISAVHYNSRSIAPLKLAVRDAERFYAAYRGLAALLRLPRFQLQYRLHDGDLVVFDNQRTLHGRTGFSSARYPRHLRGCYLTRDSVYCMTALLRRESDQSSGACGVGADRTAAPCR
ncbi:MAG TPA: TauD/TfdA family dioxygenase [Steroidobacteraceae bacterium]